MNAGSISKLISKQISERGISYDFDQKNHVLEIDK
jgi:hypothetical protein